MVKRMIEDEPRIVGARTARAGNGRATIFARHQESGLWRDRIAGLFWYDDLEGHTRRWDNLAFRTLTRHCGGVIERELGEDWVGSFLRYLAGYGSKRLFIIPQYDLDKLSVSLKPNKGHAAETQAHIREMDALQKTNWYMAAFSPKQAELVRTLQNPPRTTKVSLQDARRKLRREILGRRLVVSTDSTNDHHWVRNPADFNVPLESTRLLEIEEMLGLARDQESAEDDNGENTVTADESDAESQSR